MREPVHYPGITSCGCPYIKQRDPSKHWKECHYRLNFERDTGEQLPSQGSEAVEVVAVAHVRHFASTTFDWEDGKGSSHLPPGDQPLMTVAQHDRIMATATPTDSRIVPVELLERIAYMMETCELYGPTFRELRALLDSKP